MVSSARRSLTALPVAVQSFVQLQPCTPDADQINGSIRVQICGDTGGAWHSSGVDHLFRPPPCVLRTIKEDARCTEGEDSTERQSETLFPITLERRSIR